MKQPTPEDKRADSLVSEWSGNLNYRKVVEYLDRESLKRAIAREIRAAIKADRSARAGKKGRVK